MSERPTLGLVEKAEEKPVDKEEVERARACRALALAQVRESIANAMVSRVEEAGSFAESFPEINVPWSRAQVRSVGDRIMLTMDGQDYEVLVRRFP